MFTPRPEPLCRTFEQASQTRFVKIAHRRFAPRLNPFWVLSSQVVVNLLLKLGHGVDRVADYECLERSLVRGEHNELDKRAGAFVHLCLLGSQRDRSSLYAQAREQASN